MIGQLDVCLDALETRRPRRLRIRLLVNRGEIPPIGRSQTNQGHMVRVWVKITGLLPKRHAEMLDTTKSVFHILLIQNVVKIMALHLNSIDLDGFWT